MRGGKKNQDKPLYQSVGGGGKKREKDEVKDGGEKGFGLS